MYYHKHTQRTMRELPNRLPGRVGTQWPRDEAMYRAEGYCELVPAKAPPPGYEVERRDIQPDGDDMREVLTLRTVADGDALRKLESDAQVLTERDRIVADPQPQEKVLLDMIEALNKRVTELEAKARTETRQ